MPCRAISGWREKKNENFFKNMLDVSNGFVYSLPRTHYGAARKSKPTVNQHRGRLGRARQFSMHGLSVAPQDRSDAERMVNLTMRGAGEAKEREEKGRDACRGLKRRRSSEELPSGVIHGTGESAER